MAIARIFLFIFFVLFFFLCSAQDTGKKIVKDSIIHKEALISFKDTIISNGDTLLLRKEIWIKERDSIFIPVDSIPLSGFTIILPGRSIRIDHFKDTIIVLQDTIVSRNERALKKIKAFTERKTWWAGLLRNFIVFEVTKPQSDNFKLQATQQSEDRYDPFQGKIIRDIHIKVLDVFGNSIKNPKARPKGLLEKSGNVLHINTRRAIIRNRLLFKKGEEVDVLKIAESERLIRENNYIYDVRILVRDTLCYRDSVDVDVIVQDVWSISGAAGAVPAKDVYTASITEVNFLGLGQYVRNAFKFDPLLPNGYNYYGNYIVNNVYKTFLTMELFYKYEWGQTYYGGGLNREFISPAIKWAGGVNVSKNEFYYFLYNDSIMPVEAQLVRNRISDAWLGYGWNIFENSYYKGTRFIVSGRVANTVFDKAPIVPDTVMPTHYTNWTYFGSMGLIARKFYRDSYIARLGRTEDIPEGYLVTFTGGYERRSIGNRPYMGLSLAFSRYYRKGFFYVGTNLGAFNNNGNWEQGVFNMQGLYFTPLLKLGKWRARQYIGSRYIVGINQGPGMKLTVNNEDGLRGFTTSLVYGTKKWVINWELDLLPPLNMLGFRAAWIIFSDIAWVTLKGDLLNKNNFYPSVGTGIRFRNDHLIFSILQLNIAYFPNNNSIGRPDLYYFERSKFFYNYYNIQFNRPSNLVFYN